MENKLGTIISKLRKEKGLTQKDLANELNISDKAVSRWETGGSSPNMDMLLRISKFFNVPLNDLITARVATQEDDDEIVQEIIKEFTEMNKKNSKRIKTILVTTLVIILILTMTIIFTHSFNRFKVYKVHIETDDITPIEGVYVETKIKDILQLGDIEIKNLEIKDTDTISVDLYYIENGKEYILQSYSSLKGIYFVTYQSYFKIDDLSDYFDNLYLKIIVMDYQNNKKEYNTKLDFVLDFSNNKVFYEENNGIAESRAKTNLSEDDIRKILINNDFEETSGEILWKETEKYSINYFGDSNKISFSYEENNLSYRYTFQLKTNILTVIVFDENTTEIENYKYDVTNDKVISCNVGGCNSYKQAMKVLNKNILNLLYER